MFQISLLRPRGLCGQERRRWRKEGKWKPGYGELRKLVKGFGPDPVGKGDPLKGQGQGQVRRQGELRRVAGHLVRREQALESVGSGWRSECCPRREDDRLTSEYGQGNSKKEVGARACGKVLLGLGCWLYVEDWESGQLRG